MRGRWRWPLRAAALALAVFATLWTWGLAEAVRQPIMRQATLPLPGLPAGGAPYRVALLSDIHFGNRAMRPERLAAIVRAVNAQRPDLVLLAGDYVNGDDRLETDPEELTRGLAGLHGRDGVIAVLGNHDHWPALTKVREALTLAGIRVLANSTERAGPLLVLGLDDAHSGHADMPKLIAAWKAADGGAPLVLTHSPVAIPRLPADLTVALAGHTHCGQVVFPGIGSLARWIGKRKMGPRYMCGITREPGRTVVTTAGVGSGSVPVRVGAPPDWWLLTFVAP